MPFNGSVRIIEKSKPSGFEISITFLASSFSGIISLSNTSGLSNEYVIDSEKPYFSIMSLALSLIIFDLDIPPRVISAFGSVVGILS